ncbi:MAG TPA: response regulator [Steroidobacteraceae bacterium]|nr:response regulator [Steroidobacteraceae bacterium]
MARGTRIGCTILSDSPSDAELIRGLLGEDFADARLLLDDQTTQRRILRSPDAQTSCRLSGDRGGHVLLLGFRDLAASERCYLQLFRDGELDAAEPHRTLLLVPREAASRAYELCRRGLFDDYVVFWPMTDDPKRLLMSLHQAMRELTRRGEDRTLQAIAERARSVGELDGLLSAELERGQAHIEHSQSVLSDARAALAALLSNASGEAAADPTEREHWRHRQDELLSAPLRAMDESLAPVADWVRNVMPALSEPLARARELNTLAREVSVRILVVDDDAFQRHLIGTMLSSAGYEVHFASSGQETLQRLLDWTPQALLLDLQMPELDGVEVMKRMRSDARLARVPVIMITARSDRGVVLTARKLGAADFVVKPPTRDVLLGKLARVLGAAAMDPH